ncbi:MAG TPA: VWA domain-containing protein [Pyrinomonadaceae bacterium]|nr:VWA domain-containing protein [Pyrinomonadaceae bacterium]
MIYTSNKSLAPKALLLALVCLLAAAQAPALAQQPTPAQTPPRRDETQDEVLRVSTSIVQTDVSVVDKKGQFVEGLQRDQFELKVDGKPQQVLFFERVTAGGAGEAASLAAARGEQVADADAAIAVRGRNVIFFVDDLHLSSAGILRARELLLNFIDREMTPGTHVLIASASGQIGFLQQFTNDREVLRAAAGRLSYLTQASLDNERPTMSAYLAMAIERGDRDATAYMIRQMSATENAVKLRASRVRRQAAQLSRAATTALESVVRQHSPLPGRQTLFYISEGFPFDSQEGDINYKLQRIADAAARSGTVVYSLDARGLSTGMESVDASSGVTADPSFYGYNPLGELSASQEVLRAIAADTGGRALLNTNALEAAVTKTLAETTNYYVLAWRPEGALAATDGAPKFRKLTIAVKGRSDLTVRVRRGFLNAPAERESAPAARTTAASSPVKAALNAALNAPVARRDLQVNAYPTFANDEEAGSVLLTPVQVSNERLQFALVGDKRQATVEMACIVLDDKGKIVFSEGKTLTLKGDAVEAGGNATVGGRGQVGTSFSHPVNAPGLYQVRVAARDSASGLVGSAFRWVEVSDMKARRLALSSLFISESGQPPPQASGADAAPEILKADRRFARSSRLLLQFQIYHAARKGDDGPPEAEVEIKVLDNNNQAVLNAPPRKVSATPTGDPSRLPYAAEIPLGKLTAGMYWLQVSVTDSRTRTPATRQIEFTVR